MGQRVSLPLWLQVSGDPAALQHNLLAAHSVGDQPGTQRRGVGEPAPLQAWVPEAPEAARPALGQ